MIVKTVYPDVNFNFNQHRAYYLLVVHKDLSKFNRYSSTTLSEVQKAQVLESVSLKNIN